MKKIYFAPNTVIVNIMVQQILAGSPGDQVLNRNAAAISNGNDIGSRRGSFWDDDEE